MLFCLWLDGDVFAIQTIGNNFRNKEIKTENRRNNYKHERLKAFYGERGETEISQFLRTISSGKKNPRIFPHVQHKCQLLQNFPLSAEQTLFAEKKKAEKFMQVLTLSSSCPVNQHVCARIAWIFFNLWKGPVPLRGVRTWSEGREGRKSSKRTWQEGIVTILSKDAGQEFNSQTFT